MGGRELKRYAYYVDFPHAFHLRAFLQKEKELAMSRKYNGTELMILSFSASQNQSQLYYLVLRFSTLKLAPFSSHLKKMGYERNGV
jgi:hypothetical protein